MKASGIIAAAAVCAFVLAGCGGSHTTSSAPSTTASRGATPPASWTGLGAKLSAWSVAHPKYAGACEPTPCYGTRVIDAGRPTAQFAGVGTTSEGALVSAYRQDMGDATPLEVARAGVLKLLPRDTQTTSFSVFRGAGGSCVLWSVRSATLGRWLAGSAPNTPDPEGAVSIELFAFTRGNEAAYDPRNVANASVAIVTRPPESGC